MNFRRKKIVIFIEYFEECYKNSEIIVWRVNQPFGQFVMEGGGESRERGELEYTEQRGDSFIALRGNLFIKVLTGAC